MRFLVVAPQLGLEPSGEVIPGGLQQFCRCVVRALASSPSITRLGVWSQVDRPGSEAVTRAMLNIHAHAYLEFDVRAFGGRRSTLAAALAFANVSRSYDAVMYMLVNQSVLSLLPWSLPYSVWEIGQELFEPVSMGRRRALHRADTLLSISHNTAVVAAKRNPGIAPAIVVHPCLEPPLFAPEADHDEIADEAYDPALRERAVAIVANMHRGLLYKGHQQLIAGWPEVVQACPEAELWIVGGGDDRSEIEACLDPLPQAAARRVKFFGRLDDAGLAEVYRRCRMFAMPSAGEGFGLVFVEAARYGLPSIGGKYDSVKEIIVHNATGLLVEQHPHDIAFACLRLLRDDALAQRLGDAGRRRCLGMFRFRHFRERLLAALGFASSAGSTPAAARTE